MAPSSTHFRTYERYPAGFAALVRYEQELGTFDSTVENLSLTGAGLSSSVFLHSESTMLLEIYAPAFWNPVTVRSVVVWSRPDPAYKGFVAGVRFLSQSSDSLLSLFALMHGLGPI
jgi:PilZ domain